MVTAGANLTSFIEFQFESEPRDAVAARDSGAIFDCTVRSNLPIDIDWIKDGVPVNYDDRR